MYRRTLRRYAFGDYLTQEGTPGGNYITQGAGYGQMASGLIDAVDPGNNYGVRSTAGAIGSGALKGAAAGAAFGPWGALAGAGVGAVTGALNNNKAKEAEKEDKEKMAQLKMNKITNYSQSVLSTYPSYGIMEAAYGMRLPKFPAGGKLPYPTDGSDVEQLASDTAVYNGATHAQGGIDLDTNQDGSPEVEVENNEVIKDDMVLSDRLNPSDNMKNYLKGLKISYKDNDTYASLAEKLAKKKGKFEENINSTRLGEAGTAKLMTERYDKVLDDLFEDQQAMKIKNNIGEYAAGGHLNFSSGANYRKWLGYVHATGLAESTPGSQEVSIKGNPHKVEHPYGGFLGEDDPTKKAAKKPSTSSEPYFENKAEHDNFYLNQSLEKLSPEDRIIYDSYENPADKAGFIALRQPTPIFKPRKIANPFAPEGNVYGRDYYGTRAYGGYMPITIHKKKGYIVGNDFMPKYDGGGSINQYDEFGKLITEEPREDGFAGITTGKERIPFAETFENNLGNIAGGVGFLANQSQINNLETNYNPTLAKAPNYNFTSRLPYLSNQIRSSFRTASKGISGSSAQDNIALKSNLFAKSLNTLNQATSDEFAREDAFKANYNQMANRNEVYNTSVLNDASFKSLEGRNAKRGLTQQNIDAFIRGTQGNVAMKQAKELDFMKNYMELEKSGDRGVSERFLGSLTPAQRRKYFGK